MIAAWRRRRAERRLNAAMALCKASGYTCVKIEQVGNDAYLVHPTGTRYKLKAYS